MKQRMLTYWTGSLKFADFLPAIFVFFRIDQTVRSLMLKRSAK